MFQPSWKNDLFKLSWANLQLWLTVVMLIAANLSIAVSQSALGLSFLVLMFRRFRLKQPLAPVGLGRWVLALAVWALIMIPFSTDPGQSLVFFKRFSLFAALWVGATVAVDSRRQWLLLGAVLVGALSISLYGQISIWQQTGTLFQTRLGEMSNPMTSGCLLMMSLLLAVGGMLNAACRWRTRLYIGLAALPVAVGLVQTMTRGAWLGMAAGIGAMILVSRPRLFGVFLLVLIVGVSLVSVLPDDILSASIKERFDPGYLLQGNSTNQRVNMWHEGWAMVRRHPVTGVGDRDLRVIGPDYYQTEGMIYHGHLHSNPVMLAAIWGVPGLLLGMGFLGWQIWLLLRRWKTSLRLAESPASSWALGAIGVWTGFFVAGLTEWYFGDAESMLLYLALMGVALGLPVSTLEQDAENA